MPVVIRSSAQASLLVIAATAASLLAGAVSGTFGVRWFLSRAAFDATPAPGWRVEPAAISDDPLRAAIARATRALRDPATFPSTVIRTFARADDDDGRRLDGASRYVLRLAVPSAENWSLSILDRDGVLPDSQALSGANRELVRSADGSIEIVVQAAPPDDATANWLAAPLGPFQVILRLYAPGVLDGWRPPKVLRRESAA